MIEDKIIDGKLIANSVFNNIALRLQGFALEQRKPSLAVILVGNNPASEIYVKHKEMACQKVGIQSIKHLLPINTSETELLRLIHTLNEDFNIDGILIQLPLPEHINKKIIIDALHPGKDVDGFHRYNIGSLTINDPQISPCTPQGVMHLLDSIHTIYHGRHAVVIGTSNIVGRPMALELINRGATVTICNSKTIDLATISSQADILVSATGCAKLINRQHVKDGATVIDVGITRMSNGKLSGDVDFDAVFDKVSHITPVPGGVGPMTIAMLLQNTLECYMKHMPK